MKKLNESKLRPTLGHPSMSDKLNDLNQIELKRQENYSNAIDQYLVDTRMTIKKMAEMFHKEMSRINESMLIKLDDIICVDDVNKHGNIKIFLKLNFSN